MRRKDGLAQRHLVDRSLFVMTHEEIAACMGLSKQRVWQIEQKAFAKLRRQRGAMKALLELAAYRQVIVAPCVIYPDWSDL